MRALVLALYGFLLYHALRALLRWLLQPRPKPQRRDAGPAPDADMVRDPECGTFVLRDRSVARIVRGRALCFCSEECAAAHSSKNPG